MMPSSQESSEPLCPFRQLLLTTLYDDGAVMGHHGHALVDDSALKTFGTHLARTAGE
jgi:hypothetical protein